MINKYQIKITCIFSFIIGCILGVFTIIPPIMWIIFCVLLLLPAPFIICYLKKLDIIDNIDTNKCMVIGGITGFASFLGFSIIFFPLGWLINLIFNVQSFIWIKVIFTNIVFLIFMIILMSLLSGLLNMFSGVVTAYFYGHNKNNRG